MPGISASRALWNRGDSFKPHARFCLSLWLFCVLGGCGGGGSGADQAPPVQTFIVGGTVEGLSGTIVLQDNGADSLSVAGNGAFTFPAAIAAGGRYTVTVLAQPAGQTCTVGSGEGITSANVSAVSVTCAANQYTVAGTVSGLVRPVVLQNNLKDNLTVTADGAFVFAGTVAAGTIYSVTILTPPAGETCQVTNQFGTANGNVTNVSIGCAIDPGAFFIPFEAVGQILGVGGFYSGPWPPPTNGTNGLMVVASDAIGAPPTFVVHGLTRTVGFSQQLVMGPGGSVSAGPPSTLVYTTQGASGGDHLWAVDLSGGSSLVPRQVSNLTGSFIGVFSCGYFEGFEKLTDPTSAFFILGLPTDPNYICGAGPASLNKVMIRLSDSETTTPTPIALAVNPENLLALYNPTGALAGFVSIDAAQHLVFYADETFTNPKTLLSNVFGFAPFQASSVSSMVKVSSGAGSALLVVSAPDLSQTLYRVDYTGAVSPNLYTFQGSWDSITQDSKNFYFVDYVSSYTNPSARIVQVPLDGSALAQVLYSEEPASSTVPHPYLVGSSGNQLVFTLAPQFDSTSGAVTVAGSVQTLAVGVPGSLQTIASLSASFGAELIGSELYINTYVSELDSNYASQNSTEIVALDGTVLQPLLTRSNFPYSYPGLLLQVRGATDPGGVGGGGLFVLDPTSPTAAAPVQVTLMDGSAFALPSKSIAPSLQQLAPGIAIGGVDYPTQNIGLLYDMTQHVVVPLSLPNTNVSVLGAPF
jgi:hypothetical protein